jgi:uncharacterized DUF497 family protein
MRLIFEWDANKARSNQTKHKVGFEEAKTVFNDPFLITFSMNFIPTVKNATSASAVLFPADCYWWSTRNRQQKMVW